MRSIYRLVLACGCLAVLVAGLCGCGPGLVKPPASAALSTSIAPGGLKFFVYSWGSLEGAELDSEGRYQRSGEPVPEGELPPLYYITDHRESFEVALKDKIAATAYCRDGYFILSRHFLPGESKARGECKELATPEDRQRFGDDPSP